MNTLLIVKSESAVDTTNTQISTHSRCPDVEPDASACAHTQDSNILNPKYEVKIIHTRVSDMNQLHTTQSVVISHYAMQ